MRDNGIQEAHSVAPKGFRQFREMSQLEKGQGGDAGKGGDTRRRLCYLMRDFRGPGMCKNCAPRQLENEEAESR